MQGVPPRPEAVYRAESSVAGLTAGSGLNDSIAAECSITARAQFVGRPVNGVTMRKQVYFGALAHWHIGTLTVGRSDPGIPGVVLKGA
jgi:hypothetical protein